MTFVFVGTYTDPSPMRRTPASPEHPIMGMPGPTGSVGIYLFRQDQETGDLSPVRTVEYVLNPSFLALDPRRRFLFAVNESLSQGGPESGEASSFTFDAPFGQVRFISRHATGGGNPCHLTADPTGRFLLVANHEHGRVSALRIGEDGQLGPLTHVQQHEVPDQTGGRTPHAHFVTFDPQGRFLLATDTGADRVFVYRLDLESGRLEPNAAPFGQTHAGAGPRHLAFHPSGRYVFANGESDMTLTVFAYDAQRGALERVAAASTLPEEATGRRDYSTAQVAAHPNGKFVYVSNRGHDSIAILRFDEQTGGVELVATEPTQGHTPRNFNLDPAGRYLYAANQNSESIVCFRIDPQTGRLNATGHVTRVPAPTCVLFA